jgi:hypothetical protein
MNVENGTETAHFLFWEYINGISVAVQGKPKTYFCSLYKLLDAAE